MVPRELRAAEYAVQALRAMTFPCENAKQVAYHVGWLNALDAVAAALDVPEIETARREGRAVMGPTLDAHASS